MEENPDNRPPPPPKLVENPEDNPPLPPPVVHELSDGGMSRSRKVIESGPCEEVIPQLFRKCLLPAKDTEAQYNKVTKPEVIKQLISEKRRTRCLEEVLCCYGRYVDANRRKLQAPSFVRTTTELASERNEREPTASSLQTSRTVASQSTRKHRIKIPDPPLLTDGKNPKYQVWLRQIKNKISTNYDQFASEEPFDTETAITAYIMSRTSGEAADHLLPFLDAREKEDVLVCDTDVYKFLGDKFDNPFKRKEAKHQTRRPEQRSLPHHQEKRTFVRT